MVKIQTIEKLFNYILLCSFLLLPILYLLGNSKKSRLAIVLAVYGLFFFFALFFYYDFPRNFRKVQQTLYTSLEFLVFSYAIIYHSQTKKLRNFIRLFTFGFIIFQVVHFFFSKPQAMDSVPIGVETILIYIFAILFLRQYFKYNLSYNIYEYQSFWLIVGILLYLGGSFFFNILANELSTEQIKTYWHYTYLPEIIKNILFSLVVLGYPFKHRANTITKKSTDIPNLDMI